LNEEEKEQEHGKNAHCKRSNEVAHIQERTQGGNPRSNIPNILG
jgi:hypothetical protein